MALINCQECNKEISDKVKACPHCGFPFEAEEGTESANITIDKTQIVETAGAQTKEKKVL